MPQHRGTQPFQTATHTVQASAQAKTPTAALDSQIEPPIVTPYGDEYHVTLTVKTEQHPRKVEYYTGQTLIGASYSAPYRITISAGALSGGQVTAKVFTDSGSSVSPPAKVADTLTGSTTVTGTADTTTAPDQVQDSQTPANATPQTNTITIPQNVQAGYGISDESTSVTWSAVQNAVTYQIWRNNDMIATADNPSYIDTAVEPGQTYDYRIAAVDGNGTASVLSDIVVVTTPSRQNTYQAQSLTTAPPDSQSTGSPQSTDSTASDSN